MYRAIIRTFDPVPKTDIELEMDIFFGFFESEEEAEEEANSIKKVILQKNPLSLKILTKTNEYIIVDNKDIIFRKLKNNNLNRPVNDNDFEIIEDFNFKKLAEYFNNEYSFQVVAYGTKEIIIPIDEFKHFG